MNISILSLLISNAFMYYFAKAEHWSFSTILLAYWFQSVIIGFFQVLRMLRLRNFSVKGLSINGSPVPNNPQAKYVSQRFIAGFFVIHFGLFHFVYLIFILSQMFGKFQDIGGVRVIGFTISGVLITTVLFFVNHLVSYLTNKEELETEQNLGVMMMAPYARIIPMHLTIIFGAIFKIPLEIFMTLKTVADVIPHLHQHKKLPTISVKS